jgi:hypothetical protein
MFCSVAHYRRIRQGKLGKIRIIQKQIAYCLLNTTTTLYLGVAPCFGHFLPSLGYQYNIAK